MDTTKPKNSNALAEHFFRNEYGKLVAVITRYLGPVNVETAEDIVQETLLKAVNYWQHNGIPKNPQAWLYTTAKNLTFNIIKRKKLQKLYAEQLKDLENEPSLEEDFQISEELIVDEQLKMMLLCCHPSIPEDQQIALILKILCGFSITEIAKAFFSTNETINKRLVRARKRLRTNPISFEILHNIDEQLTVLLKTIYLLFNEGYKTSQGNELLRYDLCLEAISLIKLLEKNKKIKHKSDCYALLALMYLNVSRFEARQDERGAIVEMREQDRRKWNQALIQEGLHYLTKAAKESTVSSYHILAAISANHCTAPSFEETNWEEIVSLYDKLLLLDNSFIVQLNRCIALSKASGVRAAISQLETLELNTEIGKQYLFHSTLGELYQLEKERNKAIERFEIAISKSDNKLDLALLNKKLRKLVPIC